MDNQTKPRYVELTYKLPDDGEHGERWYGVVTEATSPANAVKEATAYLTRKHPDALEPEAFLVRTINEERADAIRLALRDRTWAGWPVGSLENSSRSGME